jgi:hypothetical protein
MPVTQPETLRKARTPYKAPSSPLQFVLHTAINLFINLFNTILLINVSFKSTQIYKIQFDYMFFQPIYALQLFVNFTRHKAVEPNEFQSL